MLHFKLNLLISSLLLTLLIPTQAYIPAQPSNQTTSQSSSSSLTNDSSWIIQLNWLPIGIFSDGINHQLTADSSNHSIYQGVLLHFSELNATIQPPAMVPWIAMINCDSNSTLSSTQDDIFTLARDRGAAAAMLYSSTSHSCLVNQDYVQNFDKPLDVFSAGSLQGARLIESQFSNVLSAGYWFQSDLLNASASTILQQIKSLGLSNLTTNSTSTMSHSTASPLQTDTSTPQPDSASFFSESDDQPLASLSPVDNPPSYNPSHQSLVARSSHRSPDQTLHLKLNLNSSTHHRNSVNVGNNPVFLIATLANAQVTGNLDPQRQSRNQNSDSQSNLNGSNSSPNTGLAMIILYAITGCVSFMFLIVIVSGAIRAVRHPDRYGPRPGGQFDPQTGEEDPNAQPRQTRAEGLGKAILDTFPIVKFGRQNNTAYRDDPESVKQDPNAAKELKNLLENTMLNPDQENIVMSERGQETATTHSLTPIATNTNINALPCDKPMLADLTDNQMDDDDENGLIVKEASPYPLPASPIPLPSQAHLSSSSSSPTNIMNNFSKPESPTTSNPNQLSDFKHQNAQLEEEISVTLNLPTKSDASDDKDGGNVESTTAAVNNSTTCPICVCEFQDDDDIRMLPCDARHQFHKECVDPWLLNESRFCPLCRWDLSTRKDGSKIESEVVLESEIEVEPTSPQTNHQPQEELEEEELNEQTTNRVKARPAWLSFRNRTSVSPSTTTNGVGSPSGESSNRFENPFFAVPQILRRRRDQIGTTDQSSSSNDVIGESNPQPSSSNANSPVDLDTNGTFFNNNNQESVDSHNRFLKYMNQIRRHKK